MGKILQLIRNAVRNLPPPEIGTSVTRAHTARVSDSFTHEQQTCERLVNAWLDNPLDDPGDWGRELVKELLAECASCDVSATYRGRFFSDTTQAANPMEYGPPPTPSAGRYNRVGQAALYLGYELAGVRAEMERHAKEGLKLFCARYKPIKSLRCIDLSDAQAHPALHLAFDRAERLDVDYEAAQRLADVARELEIGGIIVPGVRGSNVHHYRNVVILRCADWDSWVDSDFQPEQLPL
jgi:RES domain-containing protein